MKTPKWIRNILATASNKIYIVAVAADLETAVGEEAMTGGIKDHHHMKKEVHQHIVIMMMLIWILISLSAPEMNIYGRNCLSVSRRKDSNKFKERSKLSLMEKYFLRLSKLQNRNEDKVILINEYKLLFILFNINFNQIS